MTDLNKEREAFEEAYLSVGGKQRELELEDGEYTNSKSLIGWELWQIKAKAQAVPETHLLVPKDKVRDLVTELEMAFEANLHLTISDLLPLQQDLKVILETSESGAEG